MFVLVAEDVVQSYTYAISDPRRYNFSALVQCSYRIWVWQGVLRACSYLAWHGHFVAQAKVGERLKPALRLAIGAALQSSSADL